MNERMNKVYERVLLLYLKERNDWCSIKEVVNDTLMCRYTAQKYLNYLVDRNKVEDKPTRNKGWRYRLKPCKDM